MFVLDAQLTASQVLHALHHDEPFLFLGAAFTTVGLVSIAFCAMRRRFDALLIWLAIFAFFYGQRLWFQADLLSITLPNNEYLNRMRWAITFLTPIPAFFFFRVAGFMGRGGKVIVVWSTVIFLSMVAWTLAFGPRPFFDAINVAIVTGVLWILVVRSLNNKSEGRDFAVVRGGVLCFAGGAFTGSNPSNATTGFGGGAAFRLYRMVGIAAEFDSYIGTSGVANPTALYDYLVGPRISFNRSARLSAFADFLGGGQYMHNGSTQHSYYYGNGGGAALAADGGVDVRLTRHLAFRAQVASCTAAS